MQVTQATKVTKARSFAGSIFPSTRTVEAPSSGRAALSRLGTTALCLLLGGNNAAAATLTRDPYLQQLTTTSVTIVWNLDASAACDIEIGEPGNPTARVVAGEEGDACAVEVHDLLPGTTYTYRPLADGLPLGPEATFETDDPRAPYTVLVLGDSGVDRAGQARVAARMLESPADLILHTGDMVYDAANDEWDPKFFAYYGGLLRRLVLWPCLGNHDNKDGGDSWREVFHTPANNAAADESYYSFDHGNAHVVVLNSEGSSSLGPGGAQYEFLDEDLAASEAPWKFVTFHRTIYSSGDHGSDDGLRRKLAPLFDRHEVDLVFMGHDHDYERTLPLRNDQIVPEGAGTVYVTTGGGGATLYEVGASDFTAYAEETHHFVRVFVDGGLLELEMVRDDGSIGDTLTLSKDVPTLATSTSTTSSSTLPGAIGLSTTSTTLPGPIGSLCDALASCGAEEDCEEGAVCTAIGCVGASSALEAVACALTELTRPSLCSEPLPRRFRRVVRRKSARARRALSRAERRLRRGAPAARVRRPLERVDRSLASIARAVAPRAERERISGACASRILMLTGSSKAAIATLEL